MLLRRAVTASDVPALGAPPEVKPPTFGRRQTFHTAIAAGSGGGIDSALILFHVGFSFRRHISSKVQAPAAWSILIVVHSRRAAYPEIATQSCGSSAWSSVARGVSRLRFRRVARAMGRLHHPRRVRSDAAKPQAAITRNGNVTYREREHRGEGQYISISPLPQI